MTLCFKLVSRGGQTGGQFVDNTIQTTDKIGNEQQLKQLKRQHGHLLNRPHNPKVGGSNPSPAIQRLKAAFFSFGRKTSSVRFGPGLHGNLGGLRREVVQAFLKDEVLLFFEH